MLQLPRIKGTNSKNQMKNIFLSATLAIATVCSAEIASAQFNYSFSKLTQAYTPLSGATSLTKQKLWNSDSTYSVTMPFSVKLAGVATNKIYVNGSSFAATPQTAVQSGFIALGAGLMDRGTIQGIAKSDIRYATTGTAGSRIFKLEIHNAGFEDEYLIYDELKDSISMQFWLYEGSNAVEFRYGTSRVSNFSDYFGPKMMSGYMQKLDTATISFEKFYVINGSPASAALDSLSGTFGNKGLSSLPANGTVYRFTPKGSATTGIEKVAGGTLAKVYPTDCTDRLFIDPGHSRPLDYTISSLNGSIVAKGNVNSGIVSVDVAGFAAGTYVIRIGDGSESFEAQQFIKR